MCVHIGLSIFFYTLKSLFWVAAHEATTWTRGDQPQVPRSRVSANQCTERYRSRYFCRNQRLAITMLRAIGPKWTIYQTKFGYKEVQLKNAMIQDHFTAKALPPKVLNVLTYLHCKPEYLQTMSDCPTGLRCSRLGQWYSVDKYYQNRLSYPLDSAVHSLNNWGLCPVSRKSRNFRAHFGLHNSLCIFKAKASRGTKLGNYLIFISFTSYEKSSFTE